VATYQYIGKRYTILLSLVVFLAANIWAARAASYSSLLGSRFVGGLFGGIVEALGPAMVTELFPEDELARAMVVYIGFLAGGSAIGPVFAGLLGSGTGDWRWYFGFLSIMVAANFVCCILMLPETTTHGDVFHAEQSHQVSSNEAKTHEVEVVEHPGSGSSSQCGSESMLTTWKRRSFFLRLPDIQPEANWFVLLVQPFTMLPVPIVLLTIIIFGMTIGWTVAISIAVANVFQQPPML
jgi:MFS family permease